MRRVHALLDALGAAGVLGLGVLVSCAFFYFTVMAPAERELAAQRSAAERFKARSPYQPVSTDARADKLRQFQNLFPPVETLSDQVERLYSLAHNAKLELRQGEYRLEARGSGLTAYRITLPVRGSYREVRDFVSAVLAEMPITSVDTLRFERKKPSESQLEAQLRLTIYFRSQDGIESK
ncbi:MAG: type 4a pilus biogenesis protein PilO [Betaproteobacteria bacterium]|nr:type 4a pilus biogenesis protein PilO [Betaproteobacteria bacterium]